MMLWIAGGSALIFIGYLIYDFFLACKKKADRRLAKARQG